MTKSVSVSSDCATTTTRIPLTPLQIDQIEVFYLLIYVENEITRLRSSRNLFYGLILSEPCPCLLTSTRNREKSKIRMRLTHEKLF